MRAILASALLTAPLGGCLQSVHRDGPNGPPSPGGAVRLLEEQSGPGRPIAFGDRIKVDFIGRYAGGEIWAEGPLTLIVGPGTYPGATVPLRIGSRIRMQYLNDPNDTTVRLMPFTGEDYNNEAFQVRRDRGQIIVEHTIVRDCRPMKLFLFQTGFGPIEAGLGCWPLLRSAPRRSRREAEIERLEAQVSGMDPPPPDGRVIDPPIRPRLAPDSNRYLGDDALHLAVRDARPDLVGALLARGWSLAAVDSFGFLPLHYAGWAQQPLERFVPALEPAFLEVVDTLLAHGAEIDAPVVRGRAAETSMQARDHEGQTTLGFAAVACADRLVRRLLDRGAKPNASAKNGAPALALAAWYGCPETVEMLLRSGATVDLDPQGGGTPLERLIAVSAFHQGHLACAKLLVRAGAKRPTAIERLRDRLADPGPGGFGFSNRPMARRILEVLRGS